jgi:hypothetical protein
VVLVLLNQNTDTDPFDDKNERKNTVEEKFEVQYSRTISS